MCFVWYFIGYSAKRKETVSRRSSVFFTSFCLYILRLFSTLMMWTLFETEISPQLWDGLLWNFEKHSWSPEDAPWSQISDSESQKNLTNPNFKTQDGCSTPQTSKCGSDILLLALLFYFCLIKSVVHTLLSNFAYKVNEMQHKWSTTKWFKLDFFCVMSRRLLGEFCRNIDV